MEWLQDIKVVVCETRITQKSFWVVGEWIREVLFTVVYGPVVDCDDGLATVVSDHASYTIRSNLLSQKRIAQGFCYHLPELPEGVQWELEDTLARLR